MDQHTVRLTTLRKEQLVKVGRGRVVLYPFGISVSDKRRFSDGVIPLKQQSALEWLLEHEYIEARDNPQTAGMLLFLTDKGNNALL